MGNKQTRDDSNNAQSENMKVLQKVLENQNNNWKGEQMKNEELDGKKSGNDCSILHSLESQKEDVKNNENEYIREKQKEDDKEKENKYPEERQVEDWKYHEMKCEKEVHTNKEDGKGNEREGLRESQKEDGKNSECKDMNKIQNKYVKENYWDYLTESHKGDGKENEIEYQKEVQKMDSKENKEVHKEMVSHYITSEMEECFKEGEEFILLKNKPYNDIGEFNCSTKYEKKSKKVTQNIKASKEPLLEEHEDNLDFDFSFINIKVNKDKYKLNINEDQVDFPEHHYDIKQQVNKCNLTSIIPCDKVNFGIFHTSVSAEDTNNDEYVTKNNEEETSKNVRVYTNEGSITEVSQAKTRLKDNLSDDAKDALASIETNYRLAESDMAALAFLLTIDADDSTKGNLAIALLQFVCEDVRTCVLEDLARDRGLELVNAQSNGKRSISATESTDPGSNNAEYSHVYSDVYMLEELEELEEEW